MRHLIALPPLDPPALRRVRVHGPKNRFPVSKLEERANKKGIRTMMNRRNL